MLFTIPHVIKTNAVLFYGLYLAHYVPVLRATDYVVIMLCFKKFTDSYIAGTRLYIYLWLKP